MSSININNLHILENTEILSQIVASANLSPHERVLEIGPGTGRLTKPLAETGNPITAVEIDSRMSEFLDPLVKQYNNLNVIYGNILKSAPQFDVLVANIPFNISEPLLTRLIDEKFNRAVLLVGDTLARSLEDPFAAESRLAFLVNAYFKVQNICHVPRDYFSPSPSTDGEVISLTHQKKSAMIDDLTPYMIRSIWGQRSSTVNDVLKGMIASLSYDLHTVLYTEPILGEICLDERIGNQVVSKLDNDDFVNVMYGISEKSVIDEIQKQVIANKHIKVRTSRKRKPEFNPDIRSRNKKTRDLFRKKEEYSRRGVIRALNDINWTEPDPI